MVLINIVSLDENKHVTTKNLGIVPTINSIPAENNKENHTFDFAKWKKKKKRKSLSALYQPPELNKPRDQFRIHMWSIT